MYYIMLTSIFIMIAIVFALLTVVTTRRTTSIFAVHCLLFSAAATFLFHYFLFTH